MAFGAGSNKRGALNEINVTPLVDVVLVLLIIFMVMTPLSQRGKDVTLPESQHADKKKLHSDPLVVTMTGEGEIWIESEQISEASLSSDIEDALREDPLRKVVFQGHETLTVGEVRKVFQGLRSAGGNRVSVAVKQVEQ